MRRIIDRDGVLRTPFSTCFTHDGDRPSSPASTGRLIPRRVRRICIRWPKTSGWAYGSGAASSGNGMSSFARLDAASVERGVARAAVNDPSAWDR